ncbi:HNH endonuclease [Rhodopila sp.]|uniref:HNH endonuclease n=1 Tax=Rhodopila sp. TaxID=2480087 RepID=UPI003D114B79
MLGIILDDLPRTRQEAIDTNSKYYFTLKPCVNGHLTYRKALTRDCHDCAIEKLKRYRQRHPERIKTRKKIYNEQNRERVCASKKEYNRRTAVARRAQNTIWMRNNKEHVRRYTAEHKEHRRTYIKEYRKQFPEKHKAHKRNRRARLAGVTGSHTPSEIQEIKELQGWRCSNCKVSIRKKYHVDHIMPIALGGSNDKCNLQILCPTCNLSKNAKHPVAWAQEQGRLL